MRAMALAARLARRPPRFGRSVLCLLGMAATSCRPEGSPVAPIVSDPGPDPIPAAVLWIKSPGGPWYFGDIIRLEAILQMDARDKYWGYPIEWSTSDTTVAVVSSPGVHALVEVRASQSSKLTVTAAVGEITASWSTWTHGWSISEFSTDPYTPPGYKISLGSIEQASYYVGEARRALLLIRCHDGAIDVRVNWSFDTSDGSGDTTIRLDDRESRGDSFEWSPEYWIDPRTGHTLRYFYPWKYRFDAVEFVNDLASAKRLDLLSVSNNSPSTSREATFKVGGLSNHLPALWARCPTEG